jgi:Flp pilus assembly protein TadD
MRIALFAAKKYERKPDPSPLSQPSLADVLCNDGLALHERGRYAEAVASFDLALAMRSDDAVALNNRGVALNALGRHADALASYGRALAIRPDYVQALYNRGRAYDELDRYADAEQGAVTQRLGEVPRNELLSAPLLLDRATRDFSLLSGR